MSAVAALADAISRLRSVSLVLSAVLESAQRFEPQSHDMLLSGGYLLQREIDGILKEMQEATT